MFVKHIIKSLHVSVTLVWPSSGGRLSCLVLLLFLCLFVSSSCLFGMWLYVVYVCACLMYLSVGWLVVHNFSACLCRQVVYLVCGCMLSMCVRAWYTCLWDVWWFTTSLLVCVVKLFIWYVAVCCLCVCLPDVFVCGMFGCELFSSQANIPQTCTSGTHTHRQHTATYQINNWTTQTSRGCSNSIKHERRPPEDGQTSVTETCRFSMMCFTNIFNHLVF